MAASVSLGHGVDIEASRDFGVAAADQDVIDERAVGVFRSTALKDRRIAAAEELVQVRTIVEVTYSGVLTASNAAELFVHYGYGPKWSSAKTVRMSPDSKGRWVANLPVRKNAQLNMCFTDGQGNWDNNGGENWTTPASMMAATKAVADSIKDRSGTGRGRKQLKS